MDLPLQITFRELDPSPAVETRIREKVAKLQQLCDRIISCRVIVEAPHRHHHTKRFHVRIDISLPNAELVVGHESSDTHAHENVYTAIRNAFRTAERRIKDYRDRMRNSRTKPGELSAAAASA